MPLNFPSSPTVNQEYIAPEGTPPRVWRWNGSGWEILVTLGQIVSIFVRVGPMVQISVAPLPDDVLYDPWVRIEYV